jgi:hypothetical protein
MLYCQLSHMLIQFEHLTHMVLVISLSFIKLLWPLQDSFHTFMAKITYMSRAYAKS